MSVVRAVYPGTFDPVTIGHVDIVERTARLFDEVVVAVYIDPPKSLMFSVDERVEMVRAAIGHVPKTDVRPFGGLLVELAHRVHATVIVRGLRIGSDFEYEREMALMNRRLLPGRRDCLPAKLAGIPIRQFHKGEGNRGVGWRRQRVHTGPRCGTPLSTSQSHSPITHLNP